MFRTISSLLTLNPAQPATPPMHISGSPRTNRSSATPSKNLAINQSPKRQRGDSKPNIRQPTPDVVPDPTSPHTWCPASSIKQLPPQPVSSTLLFSRLVLTDHAGRRRLSEQQAIALSPSLSKGNR